MSGCRSADAVDKAMHSAIVGKCPLPKRQSGYSAALVVKPDQNAQVGPPWASIARLDLGPIYYIEQFTHLILANLIAAPIFGHFVLIDLFYGG